MTLRNVAQAQLLGCSVISLGPLAFEAGAEEPAPSLSPGTPVEAPGSLNASRAGGCSSNWWKVKDSSP